MGTQLFPTIENLRAMMTTLSSEIGFTLEFLIEDLRRELLPADLELLENASDFAKKYYATIVHPTGETYLEYVSQLANPMCKYF
jgi:hypothetical protein